jgi:hypothetical protein
MSTKASINYDSIPESSTFAALEIVRIVAFPNGFKSLIPGYDIYKSMIEPLTQKIINSAKVQPGNDIENIREIIRSGKENGVDELEIKISKESGINIGTDLGSMMGIPCNVDFRVGAESETIISIKYK